MGKEHKAHEILDRAYEEWGCPPIFVGLSGGTDSLVAAQVAQNYHNWYLISKRAKMFHANTGIGIKKTRRYVRELCKNKGWYLEEIRAKEDCGQDYEQIVKEHGFPGPSQHIKMYIRLKERCTEELHRRYKKKRGGKIILVTGIRHDESNNRAGYKNDIIKHRNGIVWVNAIYWFTKQDKHDYIKKYDLTVNPVHKKLGMSGECLCGAYAHKGELDLIRLVEPETAEYIEYLQNKVWEAGWHWGWEDKPSKQAILEKYGQQNMFQPLCVGCGKTNNTNESK